MDILTIVGVVAVIVVVAYYFWPRKVKTVLKSAEDVVRTKIDDSKK